MVRIRPGVVHRNHQRGCAGVVGDRDASGSVDGCANSTVTCARTSCLDLPAIVPDRFQLYKRILRASAVTRGDSGTAPSRSYSERVRGDGDGWVVSDTGAAFWGRHGAAGSAAAGATARRFGRGAAAAPGAVEPSGRNLGSARRRPRQPRNRRAGRGPRGARGSGAARRPAHRADHRRHRRGIRAGGASWSYTTVIADAPELLETVPNRESAELRWVAEDEVAELPLHPGFRRELGAAARGGRVDPAGGQPAALERCLQLSRRGTSDRRPR